MRNASGGGGGDEWQRGLAWERIWNGTLGMEGDVNGGSKVHVGGRSQSSKQTVPHHTTPQLDCKEKAFSYKVFFFSDFYFSS